MQTRRLHSLGSGASEGRHDETTSDDFLWVVDLGGGELRVVRDEDALRELIAARGLERTARAYRLSAIAKTLGEIPELAAMFEAPPPARTEPARAEAARVEPAQVEPVRAEVAQVEPVHVEPVHVEPVRTEPVLQAGAVSPSPANDRANSDAKVDADFSMLDRPLEDDEEYFEPFPRRWPRVVGAAAVLILAIGGYRLVRSRHGEPSTANAPAPSVASAEPAPPAPPPVAPPAREAPVAIAPAALPPVAAAPAAAPAPAPAAAAAAKKPDDEAYSRLVAEGKRLFDGGHTKKAQGLFEQALAERQDGTEALVGLAYVDLNRGQTRPALELFERAVQQDGDYAPAVFGLAETNRQQGNRSAARAGFKRFLKLQPSGGDADIARRLARELGGDG